MTFENYKYKHMKILETQNIVKQFENHRALSEVSISVEQGTIFGLLGPNGAGKTTLIRIINQITAPDEGNVFLFGEKLKPEHIKNIGYLPEERGLYKKMKVGEQALYLSQLKGLSKRDALKKLKYWFEKFEIASWWDKKVEDLSKGMQQKVQFIVTIIHDPELLIFDEPFSGFDPINVNIIKDEILNLKENGATIIFSTHNMASVEELCDNIALINNGKSILSGEISSVKEDFKTNTYSITYKGVEKINLPERFETKTVFERYRLVEILEKITDSVINKNGILTGVSCCPGIVKNKVKVILSPDDNVKLNGEILVAEKTDPGWVPLYPSISGLLIERGSVLSHSAIVARELGLPTIVGIKDLIKNIKDGQIIKMDAGKGIIYLNEKKDE